MSNNDDELKLLKSFKNIPNANLIDFLQYYLSRANRRTAPAQGNMKQRKQAEDYFKIHSILLLLQKMPQDKRQSYINNYIKRNKHSLPPEILKFIEKTILTPDFNIPELISDIERRMDKISPQKNHRRNPSPKSPKGDDAR